MASPKFHGNHGASFKHGSSGDFTSDLPVAMGWGRMTGKTGDVGYISLSDLLHGDVNQAVYCQSEVAVTLDYTLCEPGRIMNAEPLIQNEIMWDGAQAVAPTVMTKCDFPVFTFMRVTFTGDGTIFFGVM